MSPDPAAPGTAGLHHEGDGMAGHWIGVDLGGTKILSGLFDDDLKVVARAKQPTGPEGGPAGVFSRIAQCVESVLRDAKVDPAGVKGMGLAVPGQIEPHSTRIRFAPNLDWRDLDVRPFYPAA